MRKKKTHLGELDVLLLQKLADGWAYHVLAEDWGMTKGQLAGRAHRARKLLSPEDIDRLWGPRARRQKSKTKLGNY